MLRVFPIALLLSATATAQDTTEADKRIVQTVQRLATFDYSKASQKTCDAIDRYLTANAGSEEYFQLIAKYRITGQTDSLIRLASAADSGAKAGQAVKLLFELGQEAAVQGKLTTQPPAEAAILIEAAASVGSRETTAFAVSVLTAPATPATLAEAALKGLGKNTAGQHALLTAATTGTLPAALKPAAAALLATSTEEAIRTQAATVLPMSQDGGDFKIAELAAKAGDAAKGQTVFMSYCFTCHQVNGAGIDFGPALSEIGSKLAKEALYDSIINPSTGISFGYEGWDIKMKDGNQFLGIIASETDSEIALKVPGGIVQKCDKVNITSRDKLKVSLMTPNLHTVMSREDLVNLVEYLTSLKKKP
jgi:putative heme-binding domain-containing protein